MIKLLMGVSVVGFLFGVGVMAESTNDTNLMLGFLASVSWLFAMHRLADYLPKE